jgi:hypothetical protein
MLVDEALEDTRREIGEPQLSADMAFGKAKRRAETKAHESN